MQDTLTGYSKALYASWYYYKPARLLLDAGEGIIHRLGKKIFGIRKVFLSHGHEDHISGLPSLINLRNLSNGDRDIPITVYHPVGDPFIAHLKDYLDKKQKHRLQYALDWVPMKPGEHVPLEVTRRQTRVRAFPVEHTRGWQSLGYRIEEKRQALRPDYAGEPPEAIKRLIEAHGRKEVLETVWHPLLVYTGDTVPMSDPAPCAGADLLLIDSTFRNAEDLSDSRTRHGSIDASFATAMAAGVKHLVLVHLSGRYTREETMAAVKAAAAAHGRPPRLGYFYESRYYEL